MLTSSKDVVWVEGENGEKMYSVGMVHVYTDIPATILKTDTIAAYSAHETLLNFTKQLLGYLAGHGHTLSGTLPVSTTGQVGYSEDSNN